MIHPIPPGESRRYTCDQCLTEYEITNEPKAQDSPDKHGYCPSKAPSYCPFCGEMEFEEV